MNILGFLIKHWTYLIYPPVCKFCDDNEAVNSFICRDCLSTLPYTNFQDFSNNSLKRRNSTFDKMDECNSLFYFNPTSPIGTAVHRLKYQGDKSIAMFLGKRLGRAIQKMNFQAIIPIPIHKKRMLNRGFNQSELIAIEANKILKRGLITDFLIKTKHNHTQTYLNLDERRQNVKDVFALNPQSELDPKIDHIALLDDIMTTGSTIEAAANTIWKKHPHIKISIITVGLAI